MLFHLPPGDVAHSVVRICRAYENVTSRTNEGSNPARGQESEASRSPSALLPFLLSGRAAPSVVAVEPRTPLNAQDTGCGASTTLLNSLVIAPGTRSHERSGHLPHQQGQRPQWRRRSHFSITLSTAKDSVLPPRRLTAQTEHFLCSHVLAHLPTVRGPLGYLHFRPPLLFLSLSLFLSPHLSPRANNSRLVGTVSQRGNTRCHWWNCCDLLLAPARGRKIDALLPEGG